MTSASVSLPAGPLGAPATALDARAQADFFTKLAALEQRVLSGQHPKFSFTQQSLKQVPPSLTFAGAPVLTAPAAQPAVNGLALPNGAPKNVVPGVSLPNGTARLAAGDAAPPVSFTRSENLVRAELHLNRLRIEKSLKEQANARKRWAAERDYGPYNGANTFDCAQLLDAANAVLKPVSGFHDEPAEEQPRSPHTESYYSSKVHSRSGDVEDEEEAEYHEEHAVQGAIGSAPAADTVSSVISRPLMSGLGPKDTSSRAVQLIGFITNTTGEARDDSYSPPAPVPQYHPDLPLVPSQSAPLPDFNALQFRVTQGARIRDSESYSPPPLSRAKRQRTEAQNVAPTTSAHAVEAQPTKKRQRQSRKEAAAKNVESETQVVENPRKRRRQEGAARRASGPGTAASPLPYIKPEPLSPPSGLQPVAGESNAPRRLVLRPDGTADIQLDNGPIPHPMAGIASPRVRLPPPPPPPPPPLPHAALQAQRQLYSFDGTATSPATRFPHDGFDLRRATSMQYASHAPSPAFARPLIDPSLRRSVMPVARYEQDFYGMPLPQSRDRQPSVFPPERFATPMMPPAKRRIVVDQYGNEYVALPGPRAAVHEEAYGEGFVRAPSAYHMPPPPPPPPQLQMPPPPPPVQRPAAQYYERQPPQREVIEIGDDDEAFLMPPPPRAFSRLGYAPEYLQPQPPQLQARPRVASVAPMMDYYGNPYAEMPLEAPPPPRHMSARPATAHGDPYGGFNPLAYQYR